MKVIKNLFGFAAIAVIIIVAVTGNIFCSIYARIITVALSGVGNTFDSEEFIKARQVSDDLCRRLGEEGVVLLKNENNVLPLEGTKNVNVFGWSAIDSAFLLKGKGSGSSTIQEEKKTSLLSALKATGFEYNKKLIDMYVGFKNSFSENFILRQPDISFYTDSVISEAKIFSDTAIMVISRYGGEFIGEIPTVQTKYNGSTGTTTVDSSKTYLQISTEENDLLNMLSNNFRKVIVLINSCNHMHLDFLNDARADAALYVGIPGQSAALAIGDILSGKVTPSGKVADTYIYEPEHDPSWANKLKSNNNIQYVEDIYIGYKWFETADRMGYFNNISNKYGSGYGGVVQYPFGYGLSYTQFEWTVTDLSIADGGTITKNSKIEITMSVTNTGKKAGKDVIEVYYTPPYYKDKIEKAHVNLAGFAKTALLEPGQTQQNIKIKFSAYDMASYDAYKKNNNESAAYELDAGVYEIKIMTDAHTPADVYRDDLKPDTAEPEEKILNPVITYNINQTIIYDSDPVTTKSVQNRFTGSTAYAGVPIDGSTVGAETVYLSRADFAATFPESQAKTPNNVSEIAKAATYVNTSYERSQMPKVGVDSGLRLVVSSDGSNASKSDLENNVELKFNESLILELGGDFNNDKWETLVAQMTIDELFTLVECSGFRIEAIESVGKPYQRDYDGPAGFNVNTQSPNASAQWTAFPSEMLVGCTWSGELCFLMGRSMGLEAYYTNVDGWYAPGVNLHRSAYNARNFEYFSEDGLISGKLASEVIRGAKVNGLYCYIKHLAVSEPGENPRNLSTWLTEQNLRENYLRPFEIAVKEGGANAVMTAFNNIGGVWAGACYPLNVSILREEWGFNGSVITDWTQGNDSNMDPYRGVRSGNNLWLNPNASIASGVRLLRTDPTNVYCAKMAAKNTLFTFANTYFTWINYNDDEDDTYKVEVGVRGQELPFPWWIIVLSAINVITACILGYCGYSLIKPRKTAKPNITQ